MTTKNAFSIPERSSVLEDKALQRSARAARQHQVNDRRVVHETGGRVGRVDMRARNFGQRTGWIDSGK